MTLRKLALVFLTVLACSRATDDAGLVLNIDADATVDKSAINTIVVTVDGKADTWPVTQTLPGSLGVVTSAGSKFVVVEGRADTTPLGRWSGTIVLSKGKTVNENVTLTCLVCGTHDAGVPGFDSAAGDAAGGRGGSDASGTPPQGGTTSSGGTASPGGVTAPGGTAATGGTSARGGTVATGGTSARGGTLATGGTAATGGKSATGGAVATGGTSAAGGTIATGGKSATGGASGGGAGGGTGTGGAAGSGGKTGGGELCTPDREFRAGLNSGCTFNTTDAYCVRVAAPIYYWYCTSMSERTLKVNGVLVTCGEMPLPPATSDGWYTFEASPGEPVWAGIGWTGLAH